MKEAISSKIQEKKILKRRALINAGAKMFSEKGFTETSIKNITDEASVAVGTFYTYFETKEELLIQIYEEILNISLNIADKSSKNESVSVVRKFTAALSSAICAYIQNSELSKVLLIKSVGINNELEEKRCRVLEKTNEYIRDVVKHLKKEHKIKIKDVDVVSTIITQSILGTIITFIENKVKISLNDMIYSICAYHLNALKIEYDQADIDNCINDIVKLYYKN